MTILLEINAATATSKDWEALAAFTAVMRGTSSLTRAAPPEDETLPSEKLMANVEAARAAGAEIDVNGLPWDIRIHASTKTMTKDGAWTSKRGVQPDLVASVSAELRATMSAPPAPAMAADTVVVPSEGAAPPPPPPFVTVAPGPVPVSVIAPVEAAKTPFAGIIEKIVQLKASGACDDAKIKMICDALGIPGVMSLNARPDLVPQFHALLDN
jgi:hypothetical protein